MIGEFFILSGKIGKRLQQIFNDESDKILDLGSGKDPAYHKSIKGSIVCLDKSKEGKTHIIADADLGFAFFRLV